MQSFGSFQQPLCGRNNAPHVFGCFVPVWTSGFLGTMGEYHELGCSMLSLSAKNPFLSCWMTSPLIYEIPTSARYIISSIQLTYIGESGCDTDRFSKDEFVFRHQYIHWRTIIRYCVPDGTVKRSQAQTQRSWGFHWSEGYSICSNTCVHNIWCPFCNQPPHLRKDKVDNPPSSPLE